MREEPASQNDLLLRIRDLTIKLEAAQEKLHTLQGAFQGNIHHIAQRINKVDNHQEDPCASYRLLFESLSECALILSTDGQVLYANDSFSQLMGLPTTAIVGSSLSSFISPIDLPLLKKLLAGATPPIRKGEGTLQRPDGSMLHVMITINTIDRTALSNTFAAVITDLTELRKAKEGLKRANEELEERVCDRTKELATINEALQSEIAARKLIEETLRAANERLCLAQKTSHCGVWELDTGRSVMTLSKELCDLCGLEAGLTGYSWKRWLAIVHPQDRHRIIVETQKAISNCSELNIEFRFQHPVKGFRWLSMRGHVVAHSEHRPCQMLGIVLDITERKELEEELKCHVAALAEANEAKDVFFNTLSHELRTPLSAILNAVQVLKRPEVTNKQQVQAYTIIERNVLHQARLIDDLLDLSRIMRGKLQLQCEPLDLREVVISQTEAVDGSAKKSELVIQLNLPSNPVVVYGDRVRLGQVVTNLLTNAIKFTPPQGTIDIKLVAEDNRAILSIQDSGIGMSAELLPLIFEPFRQGDTSMTRTRGGLGIGLTIARSLTEQHGGTIAAKSNGPGQGSVFFFSLPIMENKMSMSQSTKPQDSATHYRRILLVEDNPDLRATMTLLLEMLGHTVLQADNGMNALEIGANQVADLALIDIGLPDLNGYELAQRFREHPVLKNMYLVALTGYASQEHRDKALAAGFDDYLAKPVEMDALQRILDQL